MPTYILPPGIDIKAELEGMCTDDSGTGDDEVCLISQEPLVEPVIELGCGHRFNYLPIYLEVCEQKRTTSEGGNHLETTRLLPRQLKCPYCRKIDDGILPFFDVAGVEKKRWVTTPRRWAICRNTCSYVLRSGKRKGQCCGLPSHGRVCEIHWKPAVEPKSTVQCSAVLKSGPRKGMQCSLQCCSKALGEDLKYCTRHYRAFTK